MGLFLMGELSQLRETEVFVQLSRDYASGEGSPVNTYVDSITHSACSLAVNSLFVCGNVARTYTLTRVLTRVPARRKTPPGSQCAAFSSRARDSEAGACRGAGVLGVFPVDGGLT